MKTVNVCEVFTSIQGESSYSGLPCFFIRLSECNLRCKYCDTAYAYEKGKEIAIDDIIKDCTSTTVPIAEITGGEPLMQKGFKELALAMRDRTDKTILVETNGSIDISVIPKDVIAIMDIKCPGSGQEGAFDIKNISRLRPYDEVKFVLCDRNDYEWARNLIDCYDLLSCCDTVFFNPVYNVLDVLDLKKWILKDGLSVRLQVQLHKILGIK